MEVILKSEIFYKSPEFHEVIRDRLKGCTDCIVRKCTASNLDVCVEACMSPCVEFKLDYETKKSEILENLKSTMLSTCLPSPNKESCIKEVNSFYSQQLSQLFSSYLPKVQ
jgi:hypothetical protein